MTAHLLEHGQAADHAALAEAIRRAEARIEADPDQRGDIVDEAIASAQGRLAGMRQRATKARGLRNTAPARDRDALDRVMSLAAAGEQRLVGLMRGGTSPMARVAMARSAAPQRR